MKKYCWFDKWHHGEPTILIKLTMRHIIFILCHKRLIKAFTFHTFCGIDINHSQFSFFILKVSEGNWSISLYFSAVINWSQQHCYASIFINFTCYQHSHFICFLRLFSCHLQYVILRAVQTLFILLYLIYSIVVRKSLISFDLLAKKHAKKTICFRFSSLVIVIKSFHFILCEFLCLCIHFHIFISKQGAFSLHLL